MITLNTAYQSLRSSALDLNTLAKVQSRAVAQLSSGEAAPAASGSVASIVYKLRTTATRQHALEQGMVNALSFLDAQAAALQQVHKDVSRMDELATRMQDPVKGDTDLQNYMTEFTQLADDIWSARSATFNGKSLVYFTGTRAPLNIALSADGKQKMSVTQSDFSAEPTWRYVLGNPTPGNPAIRDLSTVYVQAPADVVDPTVLGSEGMDKLVEDLSQKMASNGAQRSRLLYALEQIRSTALGTDAASSKIGDVEVAGVVTRLARADVLTHGAVAMRTQANVLADAALKVLTGPVPGLGA